MPDDYGTNDGFITYHTARGRAAEIADYDSGEITAARLVGAEFIDGRYRVSFGGTKVGQRAQIREWPRNGAVDRYSYSIPADIVPTEAENATYEAALRQLVSPGSLTIDWTPNKYKRASVDGAVSVEYAIYGSASDVQTQFAIIDQIMWPILTGGEGGGDLSPLSGAIVRI